MVDRGANGGLAGSDVRILSRSSRKCTVTGIDSHELQGLDVVQCAALVQTNHGIVNLIMNEYACYGKGHTIHSSGQIEWFKNSVDDRSVQVGGKQRICTIDGYAMPLTCRGGLMYLSILGKPTDKDLERYPAVHLTGPHEWDPSVLDYTHPSGDGEPPWSNDPNERSAFDPNFDEFGDYTQRAIQILSILDDSSSTLAPCPTFMANQHDFRTYQHAVNHEAPDYEKFRPYFGWVNVDTVQKTMEQSTQWGVSLPNTFPMKRHLKSRNPALNIPRRHEPVTTDTVFSDTPAVDSGVKHAPVFVGRDTLVGDAYPMKSGKQFVNTLEGNIGRRGAINKLLSDSAKTEISNKVMDILRAYHISDWHSEPYHQNQNPAEWRYRTIKSLTNTVMNRSGAPANCWLLCLIYVCYLLNHIACTALDGNIPLLALTGITPDISIILLFTFYEKFRPYFGWVNVDTVQKTMEQSTQWGVSLPNTFPMKRHLKSRNPSLNIPRRHEPVATDTVFSDTPAVDSGVKHAQVFVGRDTLVAGAYPMNSGKQFVNTLEDNIGRRGAMDKLLSDSAKTEISNKVMDILRAYHISDWHSEPYHQNQNPAEWRYRTIKSWTNTVMNRSGAPANCWLLCLIYVCYLLNHIACTALDGNIPLLALTGITPDISIILLFTFYQPVFYATNRK